MDRFEHYRQQLKEEAREKKWEAEVDEGIIQRKELEDE